MKINIAEKLALFAEHGKPKVIAELNDQHVKRSCRRPEPMPAHSVCAFRRSWTAVSRESGQPVRLKLDTHCG